MIPTTWVQYQELLPQDGQGVVFGTSIAGNKQQINGIRLPIISGDVLSISGDAYIYGKIRTPLQLDGGLQFGFGSTAQPSITFDGDNNTGLFRAADGVIGFATNGVQTLSVGPTAVEIGQPLTTQSGQNLVLNPSGGSIDMSGKTLINVGGISVNANRYEVVGIETAGINGTTTILDIPTVSNAVYNILFDVVGAANPNSAIFKVLIMAKNIAGTITITAVQQDWSREGTLATSTVAATVSGINVRISVTAGVVAKWLAAARVTRQLF